MLLKRAVHVVVGSSIIPKTAVAAASAPTAPHGLRLLGSASSKKEEDETPRPPFPPFTRESALEKVRRGLSWVWVGLSCC